jgi:hypothetical protein
LVSQSITDSGVGYAGPGSGHQGEMSRVFEVWLIEVRRRNVAEVLFLFFKIMEAQTPWVGDLVPILQ